MCVRLLLIFGTIVVFSKVQVFGSDTREKCIAGLSSYGGDGMGDSMGGDGGDFGGMESDEYGGMEAMMEADEGMGFGMGNMGMNFGMNNMNMMGMKMEIPEADEGMEGMSHFGAEQPAVGSLSCPNGDRGSILIKRVRYGASAFPGACQNIPYCEEKFDAGVALAAQCDGKSTCPVNTLKPKFLNCGRNSNYMLVEYECVDTWATFEICEAVSTVARGASVMITSPGYLGTSKPGTSGAQMCECIIRSQDEADMYLDYLQTQLVSEGSQCPYEYVMIESKRNITQPGNDDELEVCGQRHVKGRWFAGTLRLTYASGGPMEKRRLLAKFTVDNLGHEPRIQIECGKTNANGLKLRDRPKPTENSNTQSISGSIPASGRFGPMGSPPWVMGMGMPMFPPFPPMPAFPAVPAAAPSGRPPPAPRTDKPPPRADVQPPNAGDQPPDFSKWNIKLGTEKTPLDTVEMINFANAIFKTPDSNKPPTKEKPTRRPQKPNQKKAQPDQPNKKRGAGKVMGSEIEAVSENGRPTTKQSGSGGMVAVVFGGIGAVLIVGSVGILTIHNYRKRQRIMRKEEEYASGGSASITYGKGWESSSNDSVYATVADVDLHRGGCINPAVVNDEFGTESSKTDDKNIDNGSPIFGKCSDFGTYDHISLKTPTESPKLKREVAVIEVHQSYNGTQAKLDYLNDEGCQYAKSGTFTEGNRCTDCNIERPPRRKDKDNAYDNNVGIQRQRH